MTEQELLNIVNILECCVEYPQPSEVKAVALLGRSESFNLNDGQIRPADVIGKMYDDGKEYGQTENVSDIVSLCGVYDTFTGRDYFIVYRDDDMLSETPEDFFWTGIYKIVK